jgi:opacity protein-like surface antigen
MIKKLLISASAFGLLANVALADSTNVGVNLSYGKLDASGTEQTDSASSGTGGSVVSSGSGDAKFPFGSIFLEREVNLTSFNVAIGLDYLPMSREVDKLTGGTGTDATVKVKNVKNIYFQPSKTFDNGVSLFARVGYLHGDLNVSDITRQSGGGNNQTTDSASTDASANKTLKGPAYGLGLEKKMDGGLFVRVSYTKTDLDKIEYTNSNGKKLTADADLDTLSISIGKKF